MGIYLLNFLYFSYEDVYYNYIILFYFEFEYYLDFIYFKNFLILDIKY